MMVGVSIPWSDGFVLPSAAAGFAGVLTFVLGWMLARSARNMRFAPENLPPGKQRPLHKNKTQLPGITLSGLNWSGGIASKLVFVGSAVAAALAATDLLSAILTADQRIVFAALNIVSAFVVGMGPLAVALFASRYQAQIPMPSTGEPVSIGEEQIVATIWGVVFGAVFTAAGVVMELGALWWLADKANVLVWVGGPLSVVAVVSIAYSLVTISTLTSSGCLPPMIDELKLLVPAQMQLEVPRDASVQRKWSPKSARNYLARTNVEGVVTEKIDELTGIGTEADELEWSVPEPIIPAQRRLLP